MTTSHDDDTFDFNKLERELQAAVAADEKYSRENDAKFRAVHQKVATYEEFRDIVMASHLKPLEKSDKIDGKFVQPWNMHADKIKEKDQPQDSKLNLGTGKSLRNSQEFVCAWRKISAEQRYDFLISVGAEKLEGIFKSDLGFGLLGDFLCVLQEFKQPDYDSVLEILCSLTRTNRFSLSVQFMSSKEKSACENLFKKLAVLDSSDKLEGLKNMFELKT